MDINSNELIIAVDFGTSNLKGAVFDLSGKVISYESVEYNLYTPSNSIVENDIDRYWNSLVKILQNICSRLGNKVKDVVAIGTSTQGETIVPVNLHGEPLRNAIVWLDSRSAEEAAEIAENFDVIELFNKTGCPEPFPMWPATKILWIRKNEPGIFKKTYKFLLLEDYLVYKLTGKYVGEHCLYASSYYYDIVKFEFIDTMLDFLEIDKNKLPEILKPGSVVGNISAELALKTGLNKNTKVVIGALDQICGAIGAGNISEGMITETTGSSFAMILTTDKPIFDYIYKLPCLPHAVSGQYALMPHSPTGGMVLKWFKDVFCNGELQNAIAEGKNIFKVMDDLASEVPAGSEGLIMLPHIAGAFFPEYNSDARGVYFGFGINHTKGHFVRATLESIGYMMKRDIEVLKELGINIEKIMSIGGGAGSPLWSQIKADICGLKIEIPQYTETALLGSAMLAATGIGLFDSLSEAVINLKKTKAAFTPDKKNNEIYYRNYLKYKKIYNNLKNLF